MMVKKCLMGETLLIALIFLPLHVYAAAFLIYNHDAKANGMGLAVTASIDNPSAIFYNPALLTDQPGFGISGGDTIVILEKSYNDSATGTKTDAKSRTHHIPTLFVKYTKGRLSFGVGVYSPFGLSTEWPKNWIGRYSSTFAEIKTTFVNPTIAYKFSDRVSAGFGACYVKSSVQLKNAINLFPFSDGAAKLTGDGEGLGANGGIAVKLPNQYTLAFTARSPIKIKYEGRASFYVDPLLKPLLPDTSASTHITLPYLLSGGVSKKIGALTIESDIIYTGWSAIDKYVARFADGRPSVTYIKDWHDSFSFAIGANYRWTKSFETQIGYMYDMGAAPRRTFTPELPDASKHLLTGGIGYAKGPLKANLAYQASFSERADSTSNIVGAPKGAYDTFIHVILFGLSFNR